MDQKLIRSIAIIAHVYELGNILKQIENNNIFFTALNLRCLPTV